MHTAKSQRRKAKGRWLSHILQALQIKSVNSGMWRGRIFSMSFCGCKTRCYLNSLAGPLSLTEKGNHWVCLEGVPCYSGTRQSNFELKEDGPASWLLVDTEERWGGEGQQTESRLPTTHQKHEAGGPKRAIGVAALWRTLNTSMTTSKFLVHVFMIWGY